MGISESQMRKLQSEKSVESREAATRYHGQNQSLALALRTMHGVDLPLLSFDRFDECPAICERRCNREKDGLR
jgi:hypothetical protein